MQTIRQWLDQLGLPEHTEAFERNAIDLEIAKDLTQQDLRDLGIELLGHRKVLMRAIADLNRAQASAATPRAAKDPLPSEQTPSAASAMPHMTCSPQSTIGSPKASTRTT